MKTVNMNLIGLIPKPHHSVTPLAEVLKVAPDSRIIVRVYV